LVIADGDASFLRVLNRPEFQRSDVIGVFHRTCDRDNLELLGNRITDLRQWYVDDAETLGAMPRAPRDRHRAARHEGLAIYVGRQFVERGGGNWRCSGMMCLRKSPVLRGFLRAALEGAATYFRRQ